MFGLASIFKLWSQVAGPSARPRRRRIDPDEGPVSPWTAWVRQPNSAVLLVLGSLIVFGGGRRLYLGWRARQAVGRISGDNPRVEDIEAAARHGRDGLMELFRLLTAGVSSTVRNAAGQALAVLWKRDELVVEEEMALVRRGFEIAWSARRRYPRALVEPIRVRLNFSIPFLVHCEDAVGPEDLEWSYALTGTLRASLETPSEWSALSSRNIPEFTINPGDFLTKGPHKLVVQAKVRSIRPKDAWEIPLPHLPFQFEFDPTLEIDAIQATPDDSRAEFFQQSVKLVESKSETSRYLPITADLVLRDPPALQVLTGLPCDLAHRVEIEFEGIEPKLAAGRVIHTEKSATGRSGQPIEFSGHLPAGAVERPGELRMRAILTPDPQLAWAEPDVRSLWPRRIVTEWTSTTVVRR